MVELLLPASGELHHKCAGNFLQDPATRDDTHRFGCLSLRIQNYSLLLAKAVADRCVSTLERLVIRCIT